MTMKKSLLLILLVFTAHFSKAQQYHMTGRFTNTAPDSTSLDSVAFEFTPTTYAYYINAGTIPSSTGTYMVVSNNVGPDSLVLMEDTLGVCNTNNGGSTIRFRLSYQLAPFHQLTIDETTQSVDSCPSHSYKIQGDYIGYNNAGQIIFTSSVNKISDAGGIEAYVHGRQLAIRSTYDTRAEVQVINLNGQKVTDKQTIRLGKGQTGNLELNGLQPGMYFILIQTERERKTLKAML